MHLYRHSGSPYLTDPFLLNRNGPFALRGPSSGPLLTNRTDLHDRAHDLRRHPAGGALARQRPFFAFLRARVLGSDIPCSGRQSRWMGSRPLSSRRRSSSPRPASTSSLLHLGGSSRLSRYSNACKRSMQDLHLLSQTAMESLPAAFVRRSLSGRRLSPHAPRARLVSLQDYTPLTISREKARPRCGAPHLNRTAQPGGQPSDFGLSELSGA